MATKRRFTKALIDTLPTPATGRNVYHDTEERALRLFVTPTAKTYYLTAKRAGRVRFVKLGRHPETTVQEARRRCREELAKLDRGEARDRVKIDTLTFGEVFAKYVEGYAKPRKRTWRQDVMNHKRYLSGLDARRAVDIDSGTVEALHNRLKASKGLYTANRALALLKTVFNYARRKLHVNIPNPCDGVTMFKEQSRARFLNPEELQAFLEALNSDKTPADWRDFFALALWTGARRGNVRAMRWEHIDLSAAVWTIPSEESKNSEAMAVALSAPALEILSRRAAARTESPYVFPSKKSKAGHVVEPRKPWMDIIARAKLDDVRPHDLRRTLGSWQAATGASLQVIGKTLGHRNTATTAVYSRLNLDPVRASLDVATKAMQEAANGINKKGNGK